MRYEGEITTLPNDTIIKTVVILGGYCAHNQSTDRTRFNQASDRLLQGIRVAERIKADRIVLSGGTSNIIIKEEPEAISVLNHLSESKMINRPILLDTLSRNTNENAIETAKLLKHLNRSKHIVLVTSLWHMPRAKRCFEKQGFQVIPLGTDPLQQFEDNTFMEQLIPSVQTLSMWDLILKEWLGLVIYKLKGFI